MWLDAGRFAGNISAIVKLPTKRIFLSLAHAYWSRYEALGIHLNLMFALIDRLRLWTTMARGKWRSEIKREPRRRSFSDNKALIHRVQQFHCVYSLIYPLAGAKFFHVPPSVYKFFGFESLPSLLKDIRRRKRRKRKKKSCKWIDIGSKGTLAITSWQNKLSVNRRFRCFHLTLSNRIFWKRKRYGDYFTGVGCDFETRFEIASPR